jgi:hypothetical protein
MEDEVFEKYLKRIEETYRVICDDWFSYNLDEDERKEKLKEILEEIYQMGKDNKFKDIGYIDVDEYYPENKEAKP